MIYSVTGPREATPGALEHVKRVIRQYDDGIVFFASGASWGVDTAVAEVASNLILIIPGAPFNEDLLELRTDAQVIDLGGDSIYMDGSEAYMDRNQELVNLGDHLLAFPQTRKEVKRSGTWATIRRAQGVIPVTYIPLDEPDIF